MKPNHSCEADLISRAATDTKAFGELVERYRGSVVRQCYSRVRDMDYAEDLAQEAFVRAYMKLGQLNEPSLFANWLRKIASNVCSQFLRSPARREWAWEEVPGARTSGALFAEAALSSLSEGTRTVVELFYNSGLSYAEIAEVMGTTAAAVKGRLQRARAALKEEMADMTREQESPFTARVLAKLEQISSADPAQRRRSLHTLGTAIAEDKIEQIAQALMANEDLEELGWRSGTIHISKKYRSPRLRDALIHVLLQDRMEENRLKAAGALAAQGDPSAIPYLEQAIRDPRNPKEVVAAAKSTIKHLQTVASTAGAEPEEAQLRVDIEAASRDRKARLELLHSFSAALSDPDAGVRKNALKALAELGDKRAVPGVCKLLEDPVRGIRHAAAFTLGKLGSERAVPCLAKALGPGCVSPQSIVRALGEIGSPQAVPSILDAIEHSDWNATLIVMATEALTRCATVEHIESIRSLVEKGKALHPEFPASDFLIHLWRSVLVKATDERYIPDIMAVLRRVGDDGYISRVMAVVGGAGDADRRALNAGAEDWRLQWRLIQTLKQIGGDKTFKALTTCLTELGSADAGHALAAYGERGLSVIRAALEDPNPAARLAACWVIRGIGGDRDSEARLEEMGSHDPDRKVRMIAKAALLKTRKPDAWRMVEKKRGYRL